MLFSKKNLITLIVIAIIALILIWFIISSEKQRDLVGLGDPIQKKAQGQTEITLDDYKITISYLHSYDIEALVVGKENYSWGGIGDDLAPTDLALAWGKVAEFNTQVGFNWSQSGRWYSWSVDSYDKLVPVGSMSYVITHSSNNHLIPANDAAKSRIKRVKVGDHIHLTGYLVSVFGHSSNGKTFTWKSSTSRNDSGAHSCELIYVESLEIIKD